MLAPIPSRRPVLMLSTAFALAVASALAFVGCGQASVEDVCAKACACDMGPCDRGESACVAEGNQFQQEAESRGCGAEFDDYLGCLEDVVATCGKPSVCQAQLEAIDKCSAQR